MAIGVPGWPELAACTASIDRVRMVLTASLSIGDFSLETVIPVVTVMGVIPGVKGTASLADAAPALGLVLRRNREARNCILVSPGGAAVDSQGRQPLESGREGDALKPRRG